MKFIFIVLAASACAPAESLGLRILRNKSPDKSDEGSESAVAVVGERELLSSWCAPNTPTLWHPNYAAAWSTAGCVYTADCNSPGYATEMECCDGAYGGQVSGACKAGLIVPSSTTTKWYADYGTAWSIAGCKTTFPYPNYATTFYDTQLACCRGAYGGQTSGACLAGLPLSPTMAPVTAGGVGGKWYADYGVSWSIAGCKNTFPYPNYAAIFYSSQLECCKGAFGGQTSNACVKGLPMAPTLLPTARPTSKPTAVPTAAPTSKPTFEPTVTPSITIVSTVNATLVLKASGSARRGMRQLQAVNANFTQVFLETMQTLLAPIFSSNEYLKEVRVVSFTKVGTGTSHFLQVVFQIFLIEKCNPGLCPTDKTSTTILDDKAQAQIAKVVADGTFVKTLKAETQESVDAGELPPSSNDTNVYFLLELNETASTATATFTTFVFVTTAAPTNVPSKKPSSSPSSNPSSNPSVSQNPSSDPSNDPSSDPSMDPSSNPSSDPSTNPSSDPSMDPSSNPSSVPSTNPSSVPSRDPSSDPSMDPSSDPSMDPSSDPSSVPSTNPSSFPSRAPSTDPSSVPSLGPSISSNPSSNPSQNPTKVNKVLD